MGQMRLDEGKFDDLGRFPGRRLVSTPWADTGKAPTCRKRRIGACLSARLAAIWGMSVKLS